MSENEAFNVNILNKITDDSGPGKKGSMGFFYYFKLSRESEESQKVGNFIIGLFCISLYCIISGFQVKDFDKISVGTYALLHISAYIFSLYALLKAKHRKTSKFTYGYTRYETLAAFSNCIFMLITVLFSIMGSLHFHSEEETKQLLVNNNNKDGENSKNQQGDSHDHHHEESNLIYVQYFMLVYYIAGAFAFAEYALFSPIQDISRNYNFSGVSHENYQGFSRIYKKVYDYIHNNFQHHNHHHYQPQIEQHYGKSYTPLQREERCEHLLYSSHFENMHSLFLHFLVGLIANLGKIFTFHLEESFGQIGLIVTIIVFWLTIVITKNLLVTTSRVLLQALPVEDTKNITEFLKQVQDIEGVQEIKQKFFWGINTGYIICNINLIVSKSANQEYISSQINEFGSVKFQEISVQMETEF